jgi:hypothetical protein
MYLEIVRGFKTQVISRNKQYEEEIARDLSLMFLAGNRA